MKYRSVEMCLIKTKAALHRGADLSLSGLTALSTWVPLKKNFYSSDPHRDGILKQCLPAEELETRQC